MKRRLTEREKRKSHAYCSECLKYNQETEECFAFKKRFHLWSDKKECWSKEQSLRSWIFTLLRMKQYTKRSPQITSEATLKEIEKELRKAQDRSPEPIDLDQMNNYLTKENSPYADLEEVYYSEVHKKLAKPGGGEKADRTNKAFGPQEMKDNRFMHRKLRPKAYRNL